MRNNVVVVIRHTNERTLNACVELVISQVPDENIIIISETPFSKAVKKTFEIGIDCRKDWTLAIDADIFITNDCVDNLISTAENLEEYFFEIQGRILDKFYGVPRGGGPHLYRTKYLKDSIKFIPEEGTSLRPESDTYERMAELGHHYYFGKEIYGLHDYEQFYTDIYRKGFLHAKKHWRYLSHFEESWSNNRHLDFDFSVALYGFERAKYFKEKVYVDKNFYSFDLTDFLVINGYSEKSNDFKLMNGFVESQLQTYKQDLKMVEFEKQYFDYIKRSDKR